MARLIPYKVLMTNSGLFARKDPGFGLLVFSPYSGLIFACKESDSQNVVKWIDKRTDIPPEDMYLEALGAGWAIDMDQAKYPAQHLLPSYSNIWSVPYTKRPILMNWLITGKCPLACKYCYAEDLMRGRCKEPNESDIRKISKNILSYHPLTVVITGGDPLVSPHLNLAIKLLYKSTGIILDTCAYTFNKLHLELFRKYGVFVRISLDSEIPRINKKLRAIRKKETKQDQQEMSSTEAAILALSKCIKENIPVAVQTVATSINRSDIPSLGDKLFKLGIRNWRILVVAPSATNLDVYKKLIGDKRGQRRFYNNILKSIHKYYYNNGNRDMPIQVTQNWPPNAVILVSPEGSFYTEYKGKLLLDKKYPHKPRLSAIFEKVNRQAHCERYLNLEPTVL